MGLRAQSSLAYVRLGEHGAPVQGGRPGCLLWSCADSPPRTNPGCPISRSFFARCGIPRTL